MASGYDTQAVVETSEPRLDKSEMVGLEQRPIGLFSVKTHIKDDMAKKEKGFQTDILNMHELDKCLKDPSNMVPVYPLLVTVTGMSPKTEKTFSLEKAFKVKSEQNTRLSHHEFVISIFPSTEIFPVARDKSFLHGIQSGLKYCLKNVSKIDIHSAANPNSSSVLKEVGKFITCDKSNRIFDQGETLQSRSTSKEQKSKNSDILLTHGIGFLNIWDTSLNNKTIRPILEFFGGCFTRSNLWLFVDLDDDIDTLNLPPGGTEIDSKALGFRSQLIYLLRQCQLCFESMYQDDTHKVCTIFATYDSPSLDPQKKKNDLQDELEEAARQMGVDEFIDFKIVLVDKTAESSHLKSKLGKALNRIMPKQIPLSWLYLRHSLAKCNELCIEHTELDRMSVECGLQQCEEFGLQKFFEFFTSFGSILDMKKFNRDYIIIKPYEFLLRCDKILTSENHGNDGIIDINQKMHKEDKLCISLMMSIGMGTKIRPTQNMCYFPTIRTGERRRTIDNFAIQFVTSMSSPAMQKPVSIIEALQNHLPNAEIHPEWTQDTANTAVVSTRQDGPDQTPLNIFLSFQGNVVEISLYQRKMLETGTSLQAAVDQMLHAFHAVAKEKSLYQCKVKYHFAVRCHQNDDDSIDYYPYHKRHVLPRTEFCEQCLDNGIKNDPLIKAWITALTKDDVPEPVRLNGDLSVHDVSNFVEEVSKSSIEAIHLVSSELGEHVEKYFQKEKNKKGRMWLVLGMLQCWQSELCKEDESPKKVLARILVAVDKKWRLVENDHESHFGKLAQKIDIQALTEHQKEIMKKRRASIKRKMIPIKTE